VSNFIKYKQENVFFLINGAVKTKTILTTGSTRGIGLGIAKAFAKEGHNINCRPGKSSSSSGK
jgi:hypothetical protein